MLTARSGLGLVLCLLLVGTALASQEAEKYEAMTRAYMAAYKAYLQAKIDDDPTTPQRLKEFNEAYTSYIAALNKTRVQNAADRRGTQPVAAENRTPATASASGEPAPVSDPVAAPQPTAPASSAVPPVEPLQEASAPVAVPTSGTGLLENQTAPGSSASELPPAGEPVPPVSESEPASAADSSLPSAPSAGGSETPAGNEIPPSAPETAAPSAVPESPADTSVPAGAPEDSASPTVPDLPAAPDSSDVQPLNEPGEGAGSSSVTP